MCRCSPSPENPVITQWSFYIFQIFRVVRLFRILMHLRIGRLLVRTFRVSQTALNILILWILVMGILLGAVVYSIERLYCETEFEVREDFRDYLWKLGNVTWMTPNTNFLKLHCAYECDLETHGQQWALPYCLYKVGGRDEGRFGVDCVVIFFSEHPLCVSTGGDVPPRHPATVCHIWIAGCAVCRII